MPTHHQEGLFRALALRTDLRVVYDHALTAERRQMGWDVACSGYEFRLLHPKRKVREATAIAWAERDRLHVINGIWAEPAFAAALIVLAASGARFAIYAEAPTDRKFLGVEHRRSPARRVLRSAFGRWVANRATGLLAVSHLASNYYSELGFRARQLYPFGYFRDLPLPSSRDHRTDILDVVFVGRLDYGKGVDILLEAIRPLMSDDRSLRVTLIGEGPDANRIAGVVGANRMADRIVLQGVLPSGQIHQRLVQADLLVLPSRGDGWGMVINEAFAAGIPVIASDRCGAADLICHGVNGYVFRSEGVDDLRSCLRAFLSADRKQMRAAAAQTGSALRIPVVADYLVACLEHMSGHRAERPTAPWEDVVADLRCGRRPATIATS
jgi:glycosyltransferase involved in cell wall biosynthesis